MPATLHVLLFADKLSYPNIFTAFQIFVTIPVTTCTCKRSISGLRRLKTYLRSTMTDNRLTALALGAAGLDHMAVGRLLGVLSLFFIFQAIIESLCPSQTAELSSLPVNVRFADIYRMNEDLTYQRRRISPWGKRSTVAVTADRSTRTLSNFVRGRRALCLVNYAMIALLLQKAGDVAVLLHPGPERLSEKYPIQGNFKSVLDCKGTKFAHQNIRSLLPKSTSFVYCFRT